MPKILISEYNEFVAEIHQENFSQAGMEAIVVLNEKEVREVIQKEKIDILLINERIGGYAFVREIRKNNPAMRIFVIGVGHYPHVDPSDRKKAIEAGADEFIDNTSVTPDELLDLVLRKIQAE